MDLDDLKPNISPSTIRLALPPPAEERGGENVLSKGKHLIYLMNPKTGQVERRFINLCDSHLGGVEE